MTEPKEIKELPKDERTPIEKQADAIREKMILECADDLLEDLLKYSDEQLINSKHKTVRIKLRII